jgi:hypothetical protein
MTKFARETCEVIASFATAKMARTSAAEPRNQSSAAEHVDQLSPMQAHATCDQNFSIT